MVLALAAAALAWSPWRSRTIALEREWPATVRVIAGDGVAGTRDGYADRARFSDPFGVAIAADGTVYVSDAGDSNRIRGISPDGRVFTLAGGITGFADGSGEGARFDAPSGLALDASGNLYVADTANNAIRRVTPEGIVTTIAGDGLAGYRDGPGRQARFNGPVGVAVDRLGRVIVADTYNDRIRIIATDGTVSTLAGAGVPGLIDGTGATAQFDTPCGVAADAGGSVFVADTGNGLLRIIDAAGAVSTHPSSFRTDLVHPLAVVVGVAGEIYLTDGRGRIVEISGNATRTLAGSAAGFRDGIGGDAQFRSPAGLAVASAGRLIVADAGNALVRAVAAPLRIELRAPASSRVNPRFDPERFAIQPLLWPIAPMEGPHEIAGTLGEARGGAGSERFHAGIDVREEEGALVRAIRDGVIAHPMAAGEFGSLSEWLRIGPITYVHIRAGRERGNEVLDAERFVPSYDEAGTLVRMRVKRGARFTSGDAIGSINGFNHVHLNVGWTGEEHNPLSFRLIHFEDSVPPTIARGGVQAFDENGQRLTRRVRGRVVVSGRVQIVVDAWDQAEGNRPNRRLGVYDLGYQVLNGDGSPVPGFEAVRHTQRFNRVVTDPAAARLVYAQGSGIPYYNGRRTRFLYIVTNTFRDGVASAGFWDTTALAPGNYILRAWAADIRGNVATVNRDLRVTVEPPVAP
jgi:sugar lactone lactonase YvrE